MQQIILPPLTAIQCLLSSLADQPQQPASNNNEQVVFGQSSGVNRKLNQKWTAAWETKAKDNPGGGPPDQLINRSVRKSVRQFADGSAEIEAWEEHIQEQTRSVSDAQQDATPWTRQVKTTKTGVDKVTGRRWRVSENG